MTASDTRTGNRRPLVGRLPRRGRAAPAEHRTAQHPDVFDTAFADAALDTPFWTATHAALVLSMIFTLVALLGLYAPHADRLGAVLGPGRCRVVDRGPPWLS